MKMLKEEKELREFIAPLGVGGDTFRQRKYYRGYCKLITALVAAVREDCARIGDDASYGSPNMNYKSGCAYVAAAIRGRK